jgi:hypothetical protein
VGLGHKLPNREIVSKKKEIKKASCKEGKKKNNEVVEIWRTFTGKPHSYSEGIAGSPPPPWLFRKLT